VGVFDLILDIIFHFYVSQRACDLSWLPGQVLWRLVCEYRARKVETLCMPTRTT
jgi:hypothetical protein